MWSNFHTHSTFCDGKSTLDEQVAAAESFRMKCLGLSSHAPLPFEKGWCMKPAAFEDYRIQIDRLKTSARIPVYAGLEVDFIPGKIKPEDFRPSLDYTIGSIHFVDQFDDGNGWEIDGTTAHFREGLTSIFNNDIRAAVTRYFALTRQMVKESCPDIIGHLDKIKIHNQLDFFFSEEARWYVSEVEETLAVIKRSGAVVEINTRGVYQRKSNTTYPSPWIIRRMADLGIPVTLSSDAHHAKDLVSEFSEAARILRDAGYRFINILDGGSWRPFTFDIDGIKQ